MKTPEKPVSSRLIKELVALGIMAVLVGGYFLLNAPKSSTGTTVPKPINTTFDTDALSEVDKKDATFPSIVPNDVGRTDPFAP